MSVPYTRTLEYVLREQINRPAGARPFLAPVVAIPDSGHVTIDQGGTQTVIPRLESMVAVVGQTAVCLAMHNSIVAIGALATTTTAQEA
jgi:hypothetical protein